ncbi:transcriptional repressor NF-X1 homolog [Stylophora pistillata]|uniref:transcriptional repressor NF-X1 homolog n=1 Tax=Stylophora pistillata TaxID=50429 RepID=UPI000C03EED4|nr:transcriptional repressor NF-X1 homolog [Stylophora pistillata]
MDGSHPVGEESDSDVVDSDNSESESCFDDLSSGEEVFGERMIRMPAPCDRCSRLICKDECYSQKTGKCCVCDDVADKGCYCKRCYVISTGICSECNAEAGNGFCKRCYSSRTGKCCQCDRITEQGMYCNECYDSNWPPPLRIEVSSGGEHFKFYGRERDLQKYINVANHGQRRELDFKDISD